MYGQKNSWHSKWQLMECFGFACRTGGEFGSCCAEGIPSNGFVLSLARVTNARQLGPGGEVLDAY